MKRVHYLAGAVGLTPMALAAATPGIAHAAAEASTGHTKSVTLHHIRGNAPRAAMLDAFTVGASSPVSPDATGNGCIGRHYSRVAGFQHVLQTWWTDEGYTVCFGTVKESTSAFGGTTGHQVRVRVWSKSINGNQRKGFSKTYGAHISGNKITFNLGLHQEFGSRGWSRAYLCTAWVSGGTQHMEELAPICTATHG
jgi:hypothetical protein